MGVKNEKIVARLLRQLQQYRQLATSVKGAKVILKFASLYHLKGDFQQIKNIALVRNNYSNKQEEHQESENILHAVSQNV